MHGELNTLGGYCFFDMMAEGRGRGWLYPQANHCFPKTTELFVSMLWHIIIFKQKYSIFNPVFEKCWHILGLECFANVGEVSVRAPLCGGKLLLF